MRGGRPHRRSVHPGRVRPEAPGGPRDLRRNEAKGHPVQRAPFAADVAVIGDVVVVAWPGSVVVCSTFVVVVDGSCEVVDCSVPSVEVDVAGSVVDVEGPVVEVSSVLEVVELSPTGVVDVAPLEPLVPDGSAVVTGVDRGARSVVDVAG
ncbi:MAG: hypothetical protein WBM50_27530, partial [Acidimicrobiales bacterium]